MWVVDVSPVAVDLPGRGDELHRSLGTGDAVVLHPAELRLDEVNRGEIVPADAVLRLGLAVEARPDRRVAGAPRPSACVAWRHARAAAGRAGPWSGAGPRPRAEPAAAAERGWSGSRACRGSGCPHAAHRPGREPPAAGRSRAGRPLRASRRSRFAALRPSASADRQRSATSSRRPHRTPRPRARQRREAHRGPPWPIGLPSATQERELRRSNARIDSGVSSGASKKRRFTHSCPGPSPS